MQWILKGKKENTLDAKDQARAAATLYVCDILYYTDRKSVV